MSESESCPIDCPNRKTTRDMVSGKIAAYIFAFICCGFLGFQAKSYHDKDKELPLIVWVPCLTVIGTALGVNVQPEAIGRLISPLLKP